MGSLLSAEVSSPRGRPDPPRYLDGALDPGTLEFLALDRVRGLEALPDLASHQFLKRVSLLDVPDLVSLREVLAAPSLEVLTVQPFRPSDEEWELLLGHPTLQVIHAHHRSPARRRVLEQRFLTDVLLPSCYVWC